MAGPGRLPLVLLPAAGCDADLYRLQIDALADLVKPIPLVVAEPDMGRACAAAVVQAPSRFLLAGTSYGANLALDIAAAVPERVAGLWLMGCNPGPHPDPRTARTLAKRVAESEKAAVIEELAAEIAEPAGPRGAEAIEAFRFMTRRMEVDAFAWQINSLASRTGRLPDLPQLAQPTLLLWGANDRLVAPSNGQLMQRLMARAELVVLPLCGHLPTLEYPDEAIAAARRWIRRGLA
jgi:pimeloyl-ACP methyl ester carboxylesterase